MYLKSIEIHGFKSFADRIKLDFLNGITGIVGPNGSGKSNVADAVRWVLGEQSARQLRGSSMQDVIFSGTEIRKPMGYAYVAISIDNSDRALSADFDEVTVTRRVYRSGESDYLINGNECRLKDINELFYDTGIGKEGYSIIGQGQIDKILSGRPEDRRELFDEAAGIVKFKKRKDTAIKRLESEKNNLVRVNDILSEVERQVGPLEKQSEAAKEYLKKKEELKTLDANVFVLESKRYEEQIKELDEKYAIVEKDSADVDSQMEQSRVRYDEMGKDIAKDAYNKIKEKAEKVIENVRENLDIIAVVAAVRSHNPPTNIVNACSYVINNKNLLDKRDEELEGLIVSGYLLIYLFIGGMKDKNKQINRLQDIIQTNMQYVDNEFELRNTYSQIGVETESSIKYIFMTQSIMKNTFTSTKDYNKFPLKIKTSFAY